MRGRALRDPGILGRVVDPKMLVGFEFHEKWGRLGAMRGEPELLSFIETLFSRGGEWNAEGVLEITERKVFADTTLQSFRWSFRF